MDIVLRASLAYFFILMLTRIVGRRELSSLEPFDLILLVMIGDLVQQGITQNDFSVTGMVLVGGTVALMTVLVAWTDFRFPFTRPVIAGRPIVILQDGEPIDRNLKQNRLTLEEVAAEARLQHGLPSLDDVQWAILEANGRISFITK